MKFQIWEIQNIEAAKKGISEIPPSEFFEETMEILWKDERCMQAFGDVLNSQIK